MRFEQLLAKIGGRFAGDGPATITNGENPLRYAICIFIGLLVGAISAFSLANTLNRQNAWPRAVMTVMAHDFRNVRDAVKAGDCSGTADALTRMRLVSERIEPAFLPPPANDRVFSQYAGDLHDAIVAASVAGADCPRLAEAVTPIKNACDACHRDYR